MHTCLGYAKLLKVGDLTKGFETKTDETLPFLLIMSKNGDESANISKKNSNFAVRKK